MYIECNGNQYSTYDKSLKAQDCVKESQKKWEIAEKKCLANPACVENRNKSELIIYSISFILFLCIMYLGYKLFKSS